MSPHRKSFGLLTLAVCMLVSAPVSADWQEDLAIEIRAEHGCEVAYISHVIEREIDGRKVILAKVHCMDQRSFDATRRDDKEFFRFSECTRAETTLC